MKSYGQFCPVAKASELFCERWTPLIIRDLHWGAKRFSELQRGVPLMSPTLLSQRLKQLEAEGIVKRGPLPKEKGNGYFLTEAGQEFAPVIEALGAWGQRWSRRELEDGEVDLGLFIWAMERSVDPTVFSENRTTIRLELTDQAPEAQFWWFINENNSVELCLQDPGHEIVFYLAATLPNMIYIIRGDISLSQAIENDRLEVLGETAQFNTLRSWFNLSPLTRIESQRDKIFSSG